MVYFIVTWSLLSLICFIPGSALLNVLKATCFDRTGDRVIMAIWSGLAIIPILLLAASFLVALSPGVGLIIFASLIILSLSRQTRAELVRLKSAFSINWGIAGLCLSLLTATLINREMEWFDTGGYHIGAIKWLAEAGATPGIALINYAFGFTSSWFAFAAPLIPIFLGNRIGAVTNGFAFLITALHLAVSLAHIQQKQARLSDLFAIAVSLSVIVIYAATILAGSPILVSFSPDVPITLITGIIAWVILVIQAQAKAEKPALLDSASLDVRALPLILGIGALSIKLSSLPAVAIVILFYCFEMRFALKKMLIGLVLAALLSLPMIGYGITTSGCPIFPSTLACVDLAWRVPAEQAIGHLETTQVLQSADKATAETNETETLLTVLNKRLTWLKSQRKMQIMLLLYGASIIFSISLLHSLRYQKHKYGIIWVISLGVLGMTFIIFYAPLIRFGLIYFIVIPALFFAKYASSKKPGVLDNLSSRLADLSANQSLYRAVGLGITCLLLIILAEKPQRLFSLLPLALPQPDLIQDQANDVQYTYPPDDYYRCWASALPCSGTPLEDVRLRDPKQGIRAGFVQVYSSD